MKSTREASTYQEKQIAKSINGKRTANSGATKFDKGDVVAGNRSKNVYATKKIFFYKARLVNKIKRRTICHK